MISILVNDFIFKKVIQILFFVSQGMKTSPCIHFLSSITRRKAMTNTIIKELQSQELYLKDLQKKIQEHLQQAPEGTLRVTHKKGNPSYYHRVKFHKTDSNYCGNYIKKKDMELVHRLAQKEYETALLKTINDQLSTIQKFLRKYHPNALENVYELMPNGKKPLINAYVLSDNSYAKTWQNEPFVPKGFASNEPEIYTERNERVRSKSEKILADKFFACGIPYKYECPITLKGFGTIYPDFTVLNKKTRQVFYWEHLGMMDDPVYTEKALLKIETYIKNGIYPGKQLLLSHETRLRPLNIKNIEELITEYLTPFP